MHFRTQVARVDICHTVGGLNHVDLEPMMKLTHIEKLYLTGNDLVDVPDVVFSFSHLEVLDLSLNKLKYVPDDMLSLKDLEELNMSHNLVQVWPYTLIPWMTSVKIDMFRNPLCVPPWTWERWGEGAAAVQAFYKSLLNDNLVNLRMTLVLLGNSFAGKTSLSRALVGE